jgi:hypothetical protein
MSKAISVQRVHIESSRVQTWLCELRLSQDFTLCPRAGERK